MGELPCCCSTIDTLGHAPSTQLPLLLRWARRASAPWRRRAGVPKRRAAAGLAGAVTRSTRAFGETVWCGGRERISHSNVGVKIGQGLGRGRWQGAPCWRATNRRRRTGCAVACSADFCSQRSEPSASPIRKKPRARAPIRTLGGLHAPQRWESSCRLRVAHDHPRNAAGMAGTAQWPAAMLNATTAFDKSSPNTSRSSRAKSASRHAHHSERSARTSAPTGLPAALAVNQTIMSARLIYIAPDRRSPLRHRGDIASPPDIKSCASSPLARRSESARVMGPV